MATTAGDWLRRFAEEIGTAAPTEEELEALLGLAGIAAHASERPAAPISCWLAARAGVDPEEAKAAAQRLAVALAEEAAGGEDAGSARPARPGD